MKVNIQFENLRNLVVKMFLNNICLEVNMVKVFIHMLTLVNLMMYILV